MQMFKRAKRAEELVLVFDIGSSSVGGALFYTQESGIPKIIFSVREQIIMESKLNVDKFLPFAIESLKIVTEKIYKKGLGAPSRIFCVLSSPWYAAQTRIINFEKNTPFVFSTKLADDLIQKEVGIFKEEHGVKSGDKKDNSVRLIELKSIKTMLNGYETNSPLDQKAKTLEMTIFISMSAEQVLKSIEQAIRAYFHVSEIKFSSFLVASFTTVRDTHPEEDNFLLVDIAGEVTDIAMIKKNILRESVSFPLGRNFIIRGIASATDSTFSEAQSVFSLITDLHATEKVKKKFEPIINNLKLNWLKKFQESLSSLSSDISIPSKIYIAVDPDLACCFSETIKSEEFNQYTLTESKFEIVYLSADIFHGVAMFKDDAIRDPFLIIDSIYINRFLK